MRRLDGFEVWRVWGRFYRCRLGSMSTPVSTRAPTRTGSRWDGAEIEGPRRSPIDVKRTRESRIGEKVAALKTREL